VKEDLEIALIRYNKKTWCKSALLGFFIGLAIIVPGISGSTVAIIFKLYNQFLYAVGNFFKEFKKCFVFLLPIGIGAVVGVLLGFFAVKQLLEWLPFAIVCLFAGLMIGSFPAVKDELNGVKLTGARIALLVVGACIPVAIGVYSSVATITGATGGADILSAPWYAKILLPLVVGYALAITQIVPGLSASAILMAIGWFSTLVGEIGLLFQDLSLFTVYASLAVGFVVGFFTFSKLLTKIFAVCRDGAYSLIVGLSLGSIVSMFFNGDVAEVYASWGATGVNVLDVALGIVLLIIGVVGAYLLVRFERNRNANN
jgi:putative membrane protein